MPLANLSARVDGWVDEWTGQSGCWRRWRNEVKDGVSVTSVPPIHQPSTHLNPNATGSVKAMGAILIAARRTKGTFSRLCTHNAE